MVRLTAAQRKRLPARVFGLPKQRKYPINDRSHAIAAKGRATEGLRRGWINRQEYSKIVRKADKKLTSTSVKRKREREVFFVEQQLNEPYCIVLREKN